MKCATFKLEKKEKIGVNQLIEKGYHFYEKNYKPPIYHLIMANDLSDAGSFFNPYTINFILNNFELLTDLKSYDVIETLKERLVSLSKDYFENPILKNELQDNETIFKNKKISLIENRGTFKEKNNDENNNKNNNEIKKDGDNFDKNNQKKNGIQLKCCLIDELGFSNFKGNGFIPKYNWFENGDQICLKVEVPGNIFIQCQPIRYSGEYTIIPITGEKKKDSTPKRIEDNIYTTREFGTFEVKIYLPTEKYSLKSEKVSPKLVNGVAVFNFNLVKKEITNEITSFDEL
jgi:HSP20 family molecular chaperone IbpA